MSQHNPYPPTTFDLEHLTRDLDSFALQGRTALLPALHHAQDLYGYLPEEIVTEIGTRMNVPLADVYGVIEFYSMLYHEPVGRKIIRVCTNPPCSTSGGEEVLKLLCKHLEIEPNQTTSDGEWTVESVPCLGLCEHAPAVMMGDLALSRADPYDPSSILSGKITQATSIVGGDIRVLTRHCGKGEPTHIKQYEDSGGYQALRRVFENMSPSDVINDIKASGLVGRGGAAFPTGLKWEGAASVDAVSKYVVCNADESEPGTFKDRVLMEDDPHSVLEGLIIAAYAIGAHHGYLYIRGEYPRATTILEHAIAEAEQKQYLGRNILGTGLDISIEIRRGAGAYICGEETALFESIEGKRGFPRIKPPYPTTHGLFGLPTVINNVETLCNVPHIIRDGPEAFRNYGTSESPGPKLFCLSGDVARPGLYEVPFGVTLRHLIDNLAGGIVGGSPQAVLLGGAAGAFATQADFDVPLTFEDLRNTGLPLGSGVLMAFNDTRDIRQVLKGLAHFFADESCGKCYPCQLGTQRQYEILSRAAAGSPRLGDRDSLDDVGWTMTDASLCGLGQTAASAVLSALDLWPDLLGVTEE